MLVKQKTALTKPFSPPIIKASDGDEKFLFLSGFPALSFIRKRQDRSENELILYQYIKKECT